MRWFVLPLVIPVFLELIEVHGANGQRMWINVAEITTIREPREGDLRAYFASGARCIVVMVNAKFIATQESCDTIRARVGAKE